MKKWIPFVLIAAMLGVPSLFAQEGSEYEPSYAVIFTGLSGMLDLHTVDTLQKGKFSLGAFHRNIDREFSDVDMNTVYAVFGYGIHERAELGFSLGAYRQGDFDDRMSGRFDNDFPFANETIESGLGDATFGLKYRFLDFGGPGSGLAAAFNVKVPVGDDDKGLSTGGFDYDATLVGSGRSGSAFQFTGELGYTFKADAKQDSTGLEIDLADEIHYGLGAAFPARGFLRGIVEFSGITHTNEKTFSVVDGHEVEQEDYRDLTVGFRLHANGFGFAGGYKHLMGEDEALIHNPDGWTLALTYTDWDRPVVQPPPPDVAKPDVNYDPTVSIRPEKTKALVNESVRLDSDVRDPNEDPITYAWTVNQGQISGQGPSVRFTPPRNQEGDYRVSLKVSDGRGGVATDSKTIMIREDPLAPYWMDVVLFEFDKYVISPEASQILDMVVAHMRKYPNLKVKVEGHTCNLGTEDYNLALGYHRATAIKSYLVDKGGVDASRLSVISYGEHRPDHDNSQEETRRLNRRGAFRFSFVDTM